MLQVLKAENHDPQLKTRKQKAPGRHPISESESARPRAGNNAEPYGLRFPCHVQWYEGHSSEHAVVP